MDAAVAHLTPSQQRTFATVMQSTHRYSDTDRVEEDTSYAGLVSLWMRFDEALKTDVCVPASVAQHPKLRQLFELHRRDGVGLLFLLSRADSVLCLFQHGGQSCHVEFEAPALQRRIKTVLFGKQMFRPMCFVWVY